MKKSIYVFIILSLFIFTSCKKPPEEVKEQIESITIDYINDLSIGETINLSATVVSNIEKDYSSQIKWQVNDNSLVDITDNTLTAKQDGLVTLTAYITEEIYTSVDFYISSIIVNDNVVIGVKDKNIEKLYIPHNFKDYTITKIAEDSISNMPNLKEIIIEEGITEIDHYAFSENKKLEYISLPSTLRKVHLDSFEYCDNLKYNKRDSNIDDCLYLGNSNNPYLLLVKSESTIKNLVLDEGTKLVLDYAFENNQTIETINLTKVIYIGEFVFFECDNLISVEFYKDLLELSYNLFCGCSSLKKVVLPENLKIIGSYTFAYCYKLEDINIPDKLEIIKPYAFYSCYSIKEIILPNTVTKIDVNSFIGCSGLEKIVLSENLDYIGNYAFYNCSSLKTIIIPEKITTISSYMFLGCKSLESITLSSNITKIAISAFENCTSLKSIVIHKNIITIDNSAFKNCTSLTIYSQTSSPLETWDKGWNVSNCPVVWNYQE